MNLYYDNLKYSLPTMIVVIVSFYVSKVFSDIFIIYQILRIICVISGMFFIFLLLDSFSTGFLRLKFKNVDITVDCASYKKDKFNQIQVVANNQWIANLPRVGEFIDFTDIIFDNTDILLDGYSDIEVTKINHSRNKASIYCTIEKISSEDIKGTFEYTYRNLKKNKNFKLVDDFYGIVNVRPDLNIAIKYDYNEKNAALKPKV